MRSYSLIELKEILEQHRKYLNSEEGGSFADLRNADLSYANLSSADLRNADLSYANLSSADLRYANLSSADLRNADLPSGIYIFQGSKHQCIAMYGMIRIGCHNHKTEFWLDNYEKIGQDNDYNKDEIADYRDFIKWYAKKIK